MKNKKQPIDWCKFDAIWCVSYIKYSDRRDILNRELSRVGILDSGIFSYEYTMNTPFDMILFDTSRKILNLNDCDTISKHSCAFGHYSCIKKSYELGHSSILVLEDDARFLKDVGKIRDLIENLPDSEIILLNQTVGNESIDYYNKIVSENGGKERFLDFNGRFYSASSYVLNRLGMERIISSFESKISPADWYLCIKNLGDDVRHKFSITPMTLQSEFVSSISGRHNHIYSKMGISFDDYMTYESDNLLNDSLISAKFGEWCSTKRFFHIIIPTHNIENLVGRCIRSIKSQTFENYSVTIVDDASSDNTVSAIRKEIGEDLRFRIIENKTRSYAGGCRNTAMEQNVESEYTLFIDGDDEYYDDRSIERIFDAIISSSEQVDCVWCDFYSESSGSTVSIENRDAYEMAVGSIGFAPWIKCVKTSILKRFVSGRRCYNDVVQHLRQCDCIKTSKTVNSPTVMYHSDNGESVWNNKEKKEGNSRKIALLQLINDLRKEQYASEYAQRARINLIKRYEDEAKRIIPDYDDRQKAIDHSVNVQHLNIDNPVTFQDKLGFIKTYNFNPIKERCCDKIAVHDYCIEKLGKDICVPIIRVYDSIECVNIRELPLSFVMKANHGCGYNLVVRDSRKLNGYDVFNKLNGWLKEDYYRIGYEMQYSKMKKRLFAEEFIGDVDSNDDITDFKFFCFNGKPKIFQVASKIGGKLVLNFYDDSFRFINLSNSSHPHDQSVKDEKPSHFEEMKEYASILSEDFDFVRVDFYEQNDRVYLGEMTFTPGNANFHYENPQDEIDLGNMLKLDY